MKESSTKPLNEATLNFIRTHCLPGTDVRQLALQASLGAGVDRNEALIQIGGWQKALRKLPSWAAIQGILYPPSLSMEQCSSEQTARYKAEVVQALSSGRSTSLVDLTGGFGVDFSFLAPHFAQATYVEQQPLLCARAQHNFPLLGLEHVQVVCETAEKYLDTMPPSDWIFLDPARRDENGARVVRIADCSPDVAALSTQLCAKARWVLVKLSPMLDLTQVFRELPDVVREVHVVAVSGECKELLLVLDTAFATGGCTTFYTVDFRPQTVVRFSFTRKEEEEAVCAYAPTPATYLYEPNAAVLKAGAYRLAAVRYGVQKLHPDSHLYTSDVYCPDFPGRCFEVVSFAGFGKKELKNLLGDLKQAHLTVRGFPATVAALRKRLSLKEGGDTYFFATTSATGHKLLIRCIRPSFPHLAE